MGLKGLYEVDDMGMSFEEVKLNDTWLEYYMQPSLLIVTHRQTSLNHVYEDLRYDTILEK